MRFCIGVILLVAILMAQPAAYAENSHAQDLYRMCVAKNDQVRSQKRAEVAAIIELLENNGVPYRKWLWDVSLFKIDGLYIDYPTCKTRGTSASPAKALVVSVYPGHRFPETGLGVYIFGFLEGYITFIASGEINEYIDVTGNVFAAKLRPGDSGCYARTTVGAWSSELINEYLIPRAGHPGFERIYYVYADDFRGAPQGIHAQFGRMLEDLPQLSY